MDNETPMITIAANEFERLHFLYESLYLLFREIPAVWHLLYALESKHASKVILAIQRLDRMYATGVSDGKDNDSHK